MTELEWMLVNKAKHGDAHSFARLYERYYKDLYKFAMCYMKSEMDAEDVVSSAVIKAYENLPKLRKDSSFKSWIFQITANECRNALKKRQTFLEDIEVIEPSEESQGSKKIELMEIMELLEDEERLVVSLSVFFDYTSKEIASIIEKKEGSVRSIKSRALSKLRIILGKEIGKGF